MTDGTRPDGMRFGRTIVVAAAGRAIEQPVQAIVYAANARGLMGAGAAGAIRIAVGPEIEREAMTGAPHELGSAFVTGSGGLGERGITTVIHAVVAQTLGDVVRLSTVRRAVVAALRVADSIRVRTVAIPLLGVVSDAGAEERAAIAEAIVEDLVAHLRREATRLERVIIAAGLSEDVEVVAATIRRARERSWVS